MKLSPNMDYFLVGVPKDAALWPSEQIDMLRTAVRSNDFSERRGNPHYVSKLDPSKITVKPFKGK